MILDHIKITNFRQFYGVQTLHFSKSKEKNVTVIHGENGFGKTALLNAFSWCLYGTINLPQQDVLANERAECDSKDGDRIKVSVELNFRDKNNDYSVLRTLESQKINGKLQTIGENRLLVSYKDETGRTLTPQNAQNIIDQILPETMCPYFFFDGERIDNLSKKEGSKEIQNAIKNIMGLEVLERSKLHLNEVRKEFMKELGLYASSELQELIKKKTTLEDKIADLALRQVTNSGNMEALKDEKGKIEDKLREQEGAKELQTQREQLEKHKAQIQEDIKNKLAEIKSFCSKQGYLAFTHHLVKSVSAVIDEKRVRGEIPAGIKQQFVEDLLETGICICKTHLQSGSPEFESVKSWLSKSGNKDLEDAFIETSGNVKLLKKLQEELFVNLKKLTHSLEDFRSKLGIVDEELDQIGTKLDSKDSEEIKNLERRRREIDSEYQALHFKSLEISNEINNLNTLKANVDKEIDKIKIVEGKAVLAKRRMGACQDAKDLIDDVYQAIAKKVKDDCQAKISEVYSKFLKKPYTAKLLDTYELQILKSFGDEQRVVAMSQGERQITSLSFIGALVDIARRNYEEKKRFYFGGIYPIVMDSPFGQLDPEHRKNVAQGIPELAPQVILMVADQQWIGDIDSTVRPKMGKEYFLKNHNPKNNHEIKYEYTEILEG